MGRIRIQLLLEDNAWNTRYDQPKNDRYCDSTTQSTKPSSLFTEENYGINLLYDQRETSCTDKCFLKKILSSAY